MSGAEAEERAEVTRGFTSMDDPASVDHRTARSWPQPAEVVWMACAFVSSGILIDTGQKGWAIAACVSAGVGPLVARSVERRNLRGLGVSLQHDAARVALPLGVGQVAFLAAVSYLALTLGSSGLGPGWGIAVGFFGLTAWGAYRTGRRVGLARALLEELRAPAPPLSVGPHEPVTIGLPASTVWVFRFVLGLFAVALLGDLIDVALELRGNEFRLGLLFALASVSGVAALVWLGSRAVRSVTLSWDKIEALSLLGQTTSLYWADVQGIRMIRYRGLGRNGLYLYDGLGSERLVLDASLPHLREIESTIRGVLARHAEYGAERRTGRFLL